MIVNSVAVKRQVAAVAELFLLLARYTFLT